MCVLCSADCASMNRYKTEECSSYSDWQCGDCLPGFEYSISKDFPCQKILTSKIPSVVTFPTRRRFTEHENVSKPNGTSESTTSLPDEVNVGQNESSGRSHSLSGTAVAIIIVGIVAGVIIVAMLVIGCLVKKYCHQKLLSSEKLRVITVEPSSGENSSTTYSSLSSDSDLELDCRHNGDLTPPPSRCPDPGSIPSTDEQLELVRGELSHPTSIPIEHLNRVSEEWLQFERTSVGLSQIVCRCPSMVSAVCPEGCRPLMDKPSSNINGNKNLITFIANNVCHNPLELFRYIGAKDSDIYNLNDDRDRNPDRVSQKDFVYNVLKHWLQVNNEAKSHTIFNGLCHGGFHRINKSIHEQYSDLFPPK
ncbi:hypothetical protein DPMN_108398 [Dreissena polymorpha]|uniref:Uncharacterized protein n=2 Tax=Dreissena polymorpha TaxID=45954 RepID=A0A9D4K8S3_DREPO|nr:hypothetical protein DPMN_108398 [Dreissena polymorpha]